MRRLALLLLVGLLLQGESGLAADNPPPTATRIAWQPWSDSVFIQAKREHKFVLLDLHAVWCHWCHVMDDTTYSDPRVIGWIKSHYIPVSVDQDSRPDLAQRYQDYGWPATVVFNPDGGEIVKRQGYIPPDEMTVMLRAIVLDPSPGPSVTSQKPVDLSQPSSGSDIDSLKKQLLAGYDSKLGGWGIDQKFLNWQNVEYCLVAAQGGDQSAGQMAKQTLSAQLKLIDPVWGGVDQYSAQGDWDHPHFEKIMQFQAENIRIYAKAYAQWKDPVYLKTAEGIYHYVRLFLTSPDGVVYVSQDADLSESETGDAYYKLDDAGHRKLGIPRIDQHIYARENGWFIEALTGLYAATEDVHYRDEAVRAANWIIANRSVPDGGFRHGEKIGEPLSMGDSLAMGRAFLSLYQVTADPVWLDRAEQTSRFITTKFAYQVNGNPVGFATAASEFAGGRFAPLPDFDENVSFARFANLLSHFTANTKDHESAESALRFADTPAIAQAQLSSVGGLILAKQELAADPLHVAVIGKKDDDLATKLFLTAMSYPCIYKEVEWIQPGETFQPADASLYPDQPSPAAYTCAHQACSAPVSDEASLLHLLDHVVSTATATR
jgi:uncharacterized protein YyaL (SSP411 family)